MSRMFVEPQRGHYHKNRVGKREIAADGRQTGSQMLSSGVLKPIMAREQIVIHSRTLNQPVWE